MTIAFCCILVHLVFGRKWPLWIMSTDLLNVNCKYYTVGSRTTIILSVLNWLQISRVWDSWTEDGNVFSQLDNIKAGMLPLNIYQSCSTNGILATACKSIGRHYAHITMHICQAHVDVLVKKKISPILFAGHRLSELQPTIKDWHCYIGGMHL